MPYILRIIVTCIQYKSRATIEITITLRVKSIVIVGGEVSAVTRLKVGEYKTTRIIIIAEGALAARVDAHR